MRMASVKDDKPFHDTGIVLLTKELKLSVDNSNVNIHSLGIQKDELPLTLEIYTQG